MIKAQKPQKKKSDHSNHKAKHTHQKNESVQKGKPTKKLTMPDTEVMTQDGKKVKFYTDLVKGKKVLISFVYTSCGLTCPMVGRNFDKLQKSIGEDLGKKIFLISVSTDPVVDTPQIFNKWGEKFNRRDGWTLVTGKESEMKSLLLALTGNGPQRGLHTSLLLLFDGVSGNLEISSSLLPPKRLLNNLNDLRKPVLK